MLRDVGRSTGSGGRGLEKARGTAESPVTPACREAAESSTSPASSLEEG